MYLVLHVTAAGTNGKAYQASSVDPYAGSG
jgi:hypothetical protein